ncbi:MAG: deoxyguanosinetriphosphate triphosphohydrolase [Acidobacteria bacterium]|nr:deoxyguanosinetriphosphate triphosphohydrolase [Acidobacteriota bacterium]
MPALASYAMRESESRGRRYREPLHPYRSEYQRDRDRVIHSRAFRRLEKKTQVFGPDISDHFRNRLTHTIEVAQIARTVGGCLGLNIDLCEALALSHDVGHGPFSHSGERILDALMRQYGESFDHNIHALRIVEAFEEKYPGFPGLNLTFEMREGIVKHSRDYTPEDPHYRELSDYLLDQRPPLEAQLIDLADEIAYNAADLDDGYESRLLTLEMLLEELPLFRQFFLAAEAQYPGRPEKLKFNVAVRGILDASVTDLIRASQQRIDASGIDALADVRAEPERMIQFGELAEANRQIKEFLIRRLYCHERVTSSRQHAENVLKTLFQFYMADPSHLPKNHFLKINEQSLPTHRVVCDYLAGMTDDYIRRKYQEHFPQG